MRRLQVQLVILRDENAALKDQVVQKQCEIDQLLSDVAGQSDQAQDQPKELKVSQSGPQVSHIPNDAM